LPAVEAAKAYLASITKQLQQTQHALLQITWSVSVSGDTAQALLDVATTGEDAEGGGVFGGCDLIALATHGRTGIQRWAADGIAERMLRASRLPLLIVRPIGAVIANAARDVAMIAQRMPWNRTSTQSRRWRQDASPCSIRP
jgi:nucleotide-binding universal stress UspA family protein